MEALTDFLKSSTLVDFGFILIVLGLSGVLILAGLVMLIVVKRRKPFYLLAVFAILPLVAALAGAGWRYYQAEKLMAEYTSIAGDEASEWRQRFRTELLIMSTTGLPGTVLPILIALVGLVIKRSPRAGGTEMES
ncbi:MAG TPA: hypothetical protein VNA17_02435 [Pyrinomonadaceae bacterium]|nr:hypothetical protein [Pyrinomonadaceae bacterium]